MSRFCREYVSRREALVLLDALPWVNKARGSLDPLMHDTVSLRGPHSHSGIAARKSAVTVLL